MKKLFLVLTTLSAIFALAACNNGDSETIIETNEGNITKDEFYEELKAQYGDMVIQQLVDEILLEANYEVSDEEVEAELEKAKEPFESDEQFEMALLQSEFADVEEFKDAVRLSLLQTKATTEGVEVTDEELQAFYDENEDLFVEVDASHILVDDEETANEVKEKLDNGAKFEDLVEEYSTDPGSAAEEGSVGTVTKQSQMVPEFIEAALQLEEGEISDPVHSPQTGYHIIKANKRTVKTLEDNRDEIEEQYLLQNARPFTEVRNELLEDANIKVKDDQFKDLFTPQEPMEMPNVETTPENDDEQSDDNEDTNDEATENDTETTDEEK